MNSIAVIATIVLLLAGLVCYAFIAQTVRQKREQRMRLTAALKSRLRSLKFLLNGFPEGFLPKELNLTVQRTIMEVCEQLARLEPQEPSHVQDLQSASNHLQEAHKQSKPDARAHLENPQQIKEAKVCLEELYRFIHQLEKKGTLSASHAETQRNQIKQLALQVTVDNYVMLGNDAQQGGKSKLAAHYLNQSISLMERDGKRKHFAERIDELKQRLDALNETLSDDSEQPELNQDDRAEQQAQVAEEWSNFGNEDQNWKKKHVYD
ncbi:hypothetical protein [Teredinibacter turnerae]|uniref:hypothetical protein n=1 Tax=Teredinibacter turnerae TaxID=2426 RepID=UPI00035D68DC|nr:hypothetical protein [Teredinibacter turnerae]